MRTLRDLRERQVQLPGTNPPKMLWVILDRSLEERQRIKPFSKVDGVWKDAANLLGNPKYDVEARWRENSESARATKDMWITEVVLMKREANGTSKQSGGSQWRAYFGDQKLESMVTLAVANREASGN